MGLMTEQTTRRLAAEAAIARKGIPTFAACDALCQRRARQLGSKVTFGSLSTQHFIASTHNFSIDRLNILADVLGVDDIKELDEIYTTPKQRFVGQLWIGEYGSVIRDIDTTTK